MSEIDILKSNLNEAEKELREIDYSTFVLNRHIEELMNTISTLTEKIKKLEETKDE